MSSCTQYAPMSQKDKNLPSEIFFEECEESSARATNSPQSSIGELRGEWSASALHKTNQAWPAAHLWDSRGSLSGQVSSRQNWPILTTCTQCMKQACSTVMEFLNNLWGARNRVGIYRVVVPAQDIHYTAWRNWFLGINSWAPEKFKNSGSVHCKSAGGVEYCTVYIRCHCMACTMYIWFNNLAWEWTQGISDKCIVNVHGTQK